MAQNYTLLLLIFSLTCCQAQDRQVGGPCEGCEAALEYGEAKLSNTDTLPGFHNEGPQIKLTGTIYKQDGKTPANDVILYIYHTNAEGVYPKKGGEKGWGKRHGYMRGWIKTNNDGRYTFYTTRPASYPNTTVSQHIHATIKEPGLTPYYIDEFLFTDDPNLEQKEINQQSGRGGSGVVKPVKREDLMIVNRDIVLGKNIPGH